MANKHLGMLSMIARGLRELKEDVAFVGGATVGLHIDDPAAPEVRTSDDVDCVIEVASKTDFHGLEERLSALGFHRPSMEKETSICRWIFGGIPVDFMPTNEEILGFKNRWYLAGLKHSTTYPLPDGQIIRIFTLPFLLATKVEAFMDRGKGDFMASSDIEDIVTILDGASDAKAKITSAPEEVKAYLENHFSKFLSNELFLESLEGHLMNPKRAERVENLMGEIVQSI